MISLTEPILSQVQTKKIPATSLMRTWCLGTTHAKIAAYSLSYILQKNFLPQDQKLVARDRAKLKSALQLLGTMGYLRGTIMKVGQLLANLPQMMGPDLVEIFQSLHFEAPPMHYALIREVFLDEIGREPEEVFASFDRQAVAAASMGQVHRARMHNGTEVAVKIQYPDMARTIEADFKALSILLQTMRFNTDFQYFIAHIHDAREVILKEVDYLYEAAYMEKNRAIFSGTDVVVPLHYPELTTKRVLTMDFLKGQHLHSFLAGNPSQQERNHYGELISFSLVHSFFRFHTIYADLHPGNFIFMKDGRLGFIDFGCYRQFSEERWQLEIETETAMITNDKEKLLHFLTKVSFHDNPEDVDPKFCDRTLRQMDWIVRPIATKGPFDFADKHFVEEGVTLFKEMLQSGYGRTDSFYNWLNRALIGHRSLLYQLGCIIDYHKLYLQEMEQAQQDSTFSS